MLDIKWLEFQGIGRFVDKQRIDFTQLGDLTQIDGVNKNTGGSSGAGKSTIFQALEFLFGLNNKPTTVLQSRLTKNTMTVSAAFDFDGKELTITRGKKLVVDLDGNITTGSSKLSEEKIDEILGMPRELFRQMLHKRQKEGGFFLKLTPKEIHEFLTDCCGLSDMRSKVEKLDKKTEVLALNIFTAQNSYNTAIAGLESVRQSKATIESRRPVQDMDQATILDLKQKYDLVKAYFDKMQENHKLAVAQLEKTKPELKQANYDNSERIKNEKILREYEAKSQELMLKERDRQASIKNSIKDLNSEITLLNYSISEGNIAKKEVADRAIQIKKIRDSLCPTCDQTWVTEAAKAKEDQLMTSIISLKEVINKATEATARLAEAHATIQSMYPLSTPLQVPELEELTAKQNELAISIQKSRQEEKDHAQQVHYLNTVASNNYSEQVHVLNSHNSTEINNIRAQLDHSKFDLDTAVNKLKNYDALLQNFEISLKNLSDNESGYAARVEKAAKDIELYKNQLAIAEELKRAIKTYTSCSFDEALASISDTATRIIRNLPNMANATITLEGTKETKEGKIKEEVNAILHNDGEEAVPLKSLSGGEESSTDLAVDLAVTDFVENKANKGISILVLDEPFTGMDTVIIEQALEVLKNSNINKKLIIVDHNPEVKQMVDSRLVVVRDGATSTVEQV